MRAHEKKLFFCLIAYFFVLLPPRNDSITSINMPTSLRKQTPERIIMGIDPGTNILGYGLLRVQGKKAEMITLGVIDMRKVGDIYLKLGRIYERVLGIIDAFKPDDLAIEAPFFGKNAQTMLKLGRAQGVAIAAAMARQVPIHEYAPMQIKQAITGRGAVSKEQVAALLQRQLDIPQATIDAVPYLDATDALAAAYCHHLGTMFPKKNEIAGLRMTKTGETRRTKSQSWAQFAANNAHRVKQ